MCRCMCKTAGVLMIILQNSEKVNKYIFTVAYISLKLLKVYDGFLLIAVVWMVTGLAAYSVYLWTPTYSLIPEVDIKAWQYTINDFGWC